MERTQVVYGRPWPEAIAGGIFGFLLALGLAIVPGLARFIENPQIAPFILLIGTVLGALLSWRVAGRSVGVARTELERPRTNVETQRAA